MISIEHFASMEYYYEETPLQRILGSDFDFHARLKENLKFLSLSALFAEFVGTAILVTTISGAVTATCGIDDLLGWMVTDVLASITAAFCLTFLVSIFGHISGAHLNNNVTLGLLLTRKIGLLTAILYWIVQFAGSIVAGALLRIFYRGNHCCIGTPQPGWGFPVTTGESFLAEFIGTYGLVLVVLLVVEDRNPQAPTTIGYALGSLHFIFVLISGASFNFWRFIGPAIFSGCFVDWWLYLVSPIIGTIAAYLTWVAFVFFRYYGPENVPQQEEKNYEN